MPLQLHLRLKTEFAITEREASVLAELLLQARGESIRAPLRTIAGWCGCCPTRARSVIRRLVAGGLVAIEQARTPTGFNATAIYRFAESVLATARLRPARAVHSACTGSAVHSRCKQERSLKTESKHSIIESEKTAGTDLSKKQIGLERSAPRPPTEPAPPEPPPPTTCVLKDLKRRNLIKGIRSALPSVPGFAGNWEAQLAADDVLRRAEAAISAWKSRSAADKQMFERLVAITRRSSQGWMVRGTNAALPGRVLQHHQPDLPPSTNSAIMHLCTTAQ